MKITQILKSLGLTLFGIPICIFISKTLELEFVVWIMAFGLWLICMSISFEKDEEN